MEWSACQTMNAGETGHCVYMISKIQHYISDYLLIQQRSQPVYPYPQVCCEFYSPFSLSGVVSLCCWLCSWVIPITFCSCFLKCQMCCPGDLPTPLCWHSRIWWETVRVWPYSLTKVNWTVHIFLMYSSLSTCNNNKSLLNSCTALAQSNSITCI